MHILFVPFSNKEGSFFLCLRALSWRSNLRKAGKDNIPEIVLYREADETDQDYEDMTGKHTSFAFKEENIPVNSTIYLLIHGVGSDTYVANVENASDREFVVRPIDLIADRMKEIGFTPSLAKKIKALKLFVCNLQDANEDLARNFSIALGEKYNELEVDYYTKLVSLPSPNKMAYSFTFSEKQVHFFNEGKASQFRKAMTVENAIASNYLAKLSLFPPKPLLTIEVNEPSKILELKK